MNPGPKQRMRKDPCGSCEKCVKSNQKGVCCDSCDTWHHINCLPDLITAKMYDDMSSSDTDWHCRGCQLPDISDSYFESTPEESDDTTEVDEMNSTDDPSTDNNTNISYECFQQKGLHLLHINARSLLNKRDEMQALSETTNAAVLGVTESWLDDSIPDAEVAIPGYVLQRNDRDRNGGGVCMYIRNNIAFNRRTDLESPVTEFIAIDILLPKTKPILVGVCCRPPKDSVFYQNIEEQFSLSPNYMQQETYLLGNFNTNVSCPSTNVLIKALNNFKKMFCLTQLIDCHTRVTATTATTIDLILVSDPDKVNQSGVIECGFSDHHIVFCTRKLNRGQYSKHKVTQIRCMKNYDVKEFEEKLRSKNWFDVINCENVNEAWCKFSRLFKSVVDEVAPVKEVRLKQRSQLWFSGEILNFIRKRDKALLKFKKSKNNDDYIEFKRLRNLTQRKITLLKRDFVKNQLEENQNYPKKLWQNLKQLGMPSKSKNGTINIGLKSDDTDEIIFENKIVATKFNNFFCNIAAKLVKKLKKRPFDENEVNKFYEKNGATANAFSFNVATEEEVLRLLKSLNVTKSTGCDNISARFLKDAANAIVSPLTYIINLSLKTGVVPDDFKTARVVPLYKKGDCNYEGNYRPVSILPVVSKIFERLAYNQFNDYLCKGDLIYKYQSGFKTMFSTDTALTFLTDKIRFNMDKGLYTGVILLDLQKAFDTVEHNILLTKLKAIGADNSAVKWFASYLGNRKQFVQIGDTTSSKETITCGVPQGSILGPLLFNIYVNDMSNAVNCELCLYADDSMLLVSGNNVKEIETTLETEMKNISKWLESNKLSLHLGKTESILFGSKSKLKKMSKLNISCNDVQLESKSSVKYLGATIDQNMSGKSMGTNIVQKVNSGLKFLYRKKDFLNLKYRKLLCASLLQCRYDYAFNVYYRGLEKSIKTKLQTAQNKTVRYILGYDNRHHLTVNDLKKVKYLDVERRIEYLSLNLMFKVYTNTAPSYLCEFKKVSDVHSHNTRSSDLSFVIPHVNTHGGLSFMYNGAKLWNKLPGSVKTSSSKEIFKSRCKDYLFNKMSLVESSEFLWY